MTMEITLKAKKVTSDSKLEWKANPKRPNSNAYKRYEEYGSATTLAEFFEMAEKKFARADLRFDWEHGHLSIDGETYSEE